MKNKFLLLIILKALTINMAFAQYYFDPVLYPKLGINMNSRSFYICSYEYPRMTFPSFIFGSDGPLEYNRLEGKFFLNDSIYKLHPGLKKASNCYIDVPIYIIDKTAKWLMYNYHTDTKMDLKKEMNEDKDLSLALDSLDYFANMNKEDLKTYLLNDFYGINKGMKFIPISIRDSVNLETYIFIYSSSQIRTILFAEFGYVSLANKKTPIAKLENYFSNYKINISPSNISLQFTIKEKEKCGIYLLYKNGTSSYVTIDKISSKFNYDTKAIASIVIDFNHDECFLIL